MEVQKEEVKHAIIAALRISEYDVSDFGEKVIEAIAEEITEALLAAAKERKKE